jgi:hypothetical protein
MRFQRARQSCRARQTVYGPDAVGACPTCQSVVAAPSRLAAQEKAADMAVNLDNDDEPVVHRLRRVRPDPPQDPWGRGSAGVFCLFELRSSDFDIHPSQAGPQEVVLITGRGVLVEVAQLL